MSSTNRGADTDALGRYYTPDAIARAIVAHIVAHHGLAGATVWEPHTGGGAFVRALVGDDPLFPCRVFASDLDLQAPGFDGDLAAPGVRYLVPSWDALSGWPWPDEPRPAWIVGNPPFADAEAHVRAALQVATEGVAFLLRDAFAEGVSRSAFWAKHPAERWTLASRPRFEQRWPDGRIGPLLATDDEGKPVPSSRPTEARPWKLAGTDSCAYALFIWRAGAVPPQPWGRLEVSDA